MKTSKTSMVAAVGGAVLTELVILAGESPYWRALRVASDGRVDWITVGDGFSMASATVFASLAEAKAALEKAPGAEYPGMLQARFVGLPILASGNFWDPDLTTIAHYWDSVARRIAV